MTKESIQTKKLIQNILGNGRLLPDRFRERFLLPIVYTVSVSVVVLMLSVNIITSIHVDTLSAFASFIVGSTLMVWLIIYWHLVINSQRFYLLLDNMRHLVEGRIEINPVIYLKAKTKIKFFMNIALTSLGTGATMPLLAFPLAAYHWLMGTYTIDSWFFFFPVWLPFELNSAPRCTCVILLQFSVLVYSASVVYSVCSLFAEITLYSESCLNDIESILAQVDRLSEMRNSEQTKLRHSHHKEALILHEHLNRCMSQLSDVINFMALWMVVPVQLCLCASVFILDKHIGRLSYSNLVLPILGAVTTTQFLFAVFYIGQKLHSNLLELSDAIYKTEWHRYPPDVRRCMQFMMIRAQRPFYLSAYGILPLTLGNFVRVLRGIYSALMLLRNMD